MQNRKMVAPVVIVVLIALYYLGIVALLLMFDLPFALKAVIILVPLAIVGALSSVLWERIKEIRSGEEDDLSKY